MDLEEEGVLKRQVIPIRRDLTLVIRRLAQHGREYIDIRYAGMPYGKLKYTKKGIRLRAEHLDKLIMALMSAKEIEVERPLEIEVASA